MKQKNKYVLCEYFDQWVLKNKGCFHGHFPILKTRMKGVSRYRFHGIAKQVILVIGEKGYFSIIAKFQNEWFDFLLDLDFYPAKNNKGYYCSSCSLRRYYPSVEELMLDHCVKSLISWINDNFKQENQLVFNGYNGIHYVEIDKYWSKSVPVLSKQKYWRCLKTI